MTLQKQYDGLHRIVLILTLISCSWSVSSCADWRLGPGTDRGTNGTAYVMGKLEDELEVSVPIAQHAAIEGLKDLEVSILKKKGDKLTAEIEAKTADERHIWVSIHSLSYSRSKIMIRVGYMGDELRSRRILEATRTHLQLSS